MLAAALRRIERSVNCSRGIGPTGGSSGLASGCSEWAVMTRVREKQRDVQARELWARAQVA